jgi:two-component system, NtrC family, sensor kinase
VDTIVVTAKDRCRRCYSCVRRCPAKAIRVQGGQAEVIRERCLACGRCVKVCSQGARKIADNLPRIAPLLEEGNTVIMLAPSFPAAFPSWRPGQVIAGLRRAGLAGVYEVAFGADLVGAAYRRLHEADPDRLLISSPCPAATSYVRKYAVELLPLLAPVLSPMAAMGKLLKTRLRPGCRTIFAGPCTAKIAEAQDPEVSPWIDAVITFHEIPAVLARANVNPESMPSEEFDPPHSTLGGIFPVQGGLVRAAEIPCDLLENGIAEVSGPDSFTDLMTRLSRRVRESGFGDLETRLFDVLFCKGCIAGPALNGESSLIARKERIVTYMRGRRATTRGQWQEEMARHADLDLSRSFTDDNQRHAEPSDEDIQAILARTGKHSPADELNCRACGYRSCREKASAVLQGLAEVEMCLPHLVERLESMVAKLNLSHEQLTEAQAQLLRSERLASMGQLSAGIAHEVNNPLGTILIYAHLLSETIKHGGEIKPEQVDGDIKMILNEATRCKSIVSGLLDFARQNRVSRSHVNVRSMLEEAVRIIAAQTHEERVRFEIEVAPDLPEAHIDRQQILQVVLNIVRNAVEAMPNGGTVKVSAEWNDKLQEFRLRICDQGPGISPDAMKKLFSPFFTTKAQGRGTGLGLPICYGIVKMHRGSITARNNKDAPGATFEISLPGHEEPLHAG